jgi:hypothetical protein
LHVCITDTIGDSAVRDNHPKKLGNQLL